MTTTGSLMGSVVLLTGATGGLGRAIARAAAAQGAELILSDRRARPLEDLCNAIERAGHPAPRALPLDLEGATLADYETVAAHLEAAYGRLDGLVLNAAMLGDLCPIASFDAVQWARVFQVNLHANFLLLRTLLPLLAVAPHPSIVISSDSVGRRGKAYWGAYSASKAALERLAEVLAEETESDRIRVNTLDTGALRTELRRAAFPLEDAAMAADPETVAPAYIQLLAPGSAAVHGQALTIVGKDVSHDS